MLACSRATWTALLLALVTSGVASLTSAGCKKSARVDDESSRVPTPSAVPADHLAPGELVEGKEKAFGITLPRDLKVEKRYDDVIFASIDVPPPQVAKFFQPRLHEGKMVASPGGTTFEGATVPGEPRRTLRIVIDLDARRGGSRLEIRDMTQKPAETLPDEQARWNAAGMTPDGKLLDPKHLH